MAAAPITEHLGRAITADVQIAPPPTRPNSDTRRCAPPAPASSAAGIASASRTL